MDILVYPEADQYSSSVFCSVTLLLICTLVLRFSKSFLTITIDKKLNMEEL